MESRARPTRLNIDLLNYKQPWLDYCKQRKMTPSQAFRLVVAKLIGQVKTDDLETVLDDVQDSTKIRKEVRFTKLEVEQIEAMAKKEGFSLPRWIVSLVRARLNSGAQLGQQELELLARSNVHLLTMGRNLNQIAKALNTSPEDRRKFNIELIESLQMVIKDHTSIVSNVLSHNVDRWKIK